MFDWTLYSTALLAMLAFGLAGWVLSVIKKDVSIVDPMWSLMILLGGAIFFYSTAADSPRRTLAYMLVAAWAIRLCVHITYVHWGKAEDYRYQRIRANNEPNFTFKSIYIVFGLQAVLGWVVTLPLLAASTSDVALGWLDYIGVALWLFGMFFESVGDYQMARFKSDPNNKGKVYDQGLWRYTRHPNYFGECMIWWGFFLIALSAGGWWSILSPILMTILLLKVSGVAMLEQDIAERRPAYTQYIKQTNAFIPWLPRRA